MTQPRGHHHRPSRPRSVSRSSSSPSPPPTTLSDGPSNGIRATSPRRSPLPIHTPLFRDGRDSRETREKRRSFNAGRASGLSAYRNRASSRATILPVQHTLSNLPQEDSAIDENTDVGFTTQYGASVSSISVAGTSEHEYLGGQDETETEVERDRKDEFEGWGRVTEQPIDRVPTPTVPTNGRPSSRRPSAQPITQPYTLLPFRLGSMRYWSFAWHGRQKKLSFGIKVTRRRCENSLILGSVIWGIWVLGFQWGEKALAGEISLLVGLAVFYTAVRFHPMQPVQLQTAASIRSLSPTPNPPTIKAPTFGRERGGRPSVGAPSSPGLVKEDVKGRWAPDEDGYIGVGEKGCIWGTEEREYRDCLDDGILYALLLGPLLSTALLHATLSQLLTSPQSPLPRGWNVEPPLVLPSSPIRGGISFPGGGPSDTLRALSALATSRRNLVQLFTLCSFVLLVHLTRSRRLEISSLGPTLLTSASTEPPFKQSIPVGTYWLRKGELKRTRSVVGFAFVVSAGCLVVKAVTALIGRGVWSDMSPSDIVIATLFYQFSIYVCVRLAREGLTLGELAVVCCAATAMFMEVVNLTRMKISIFQTPYIKTYRLPTPLLIFQLALIPGSLLNGFLLSPLLYLSRNLAQKPAHRLRLPLEQAMHRRLLALGFYAGSALVCGGIVGVWTQWCLGWRNPWTWAVYWLFAGDHGWTRLLLMAYWGALAAIAVAAWERQLARARRHKRYMVPGSTGRDTTSSNAPSVSSTRPTAPRPPTGSLRLSSVPGLTPSGLNPAQQERSGGVATQMMDAADQRMPTLSVNARRKSFHALAVIMFVPGIAVDPAFTHLSFSVAFAGFNFAEFIRYFALWPLGVKVHLFLNEFLDHKDSGTAILSHFYLLTGCASPLWFEGPSQIMTYFGVLVLGVGDALASIVGRRLGRVRWCSAFGKTVEGSVAFFLSVLMFSGLMWSLGIVDSFRPIPYTITVGLVTLLEAFSAQNDNLILPMFGWAIGTLLGVC